MKQNVVYRQAAPLRYLGACQGIPETFSIRSIPTACLMSTKGDVYWYYHFSKTI